MNSNNSFSSSLEILDIFKSTEKAKLLSDICVGEGSSKDFDVPIQKFRIVRG